jgi:hypothetical protein
MTPSLSLVIMFQSMLPESSDRKNMFAGAAALTNRGACARLSCVAGADWDAKRVVATPAASRKRLRETWLLGANFL